MVSSWTLLSLATLAVAGPIKSAQDYARDLRLQARQSVSDAQVDNFALYAEYSTASYCNYDVEPGTAISCGGECETIEADNATVVGTFDGFWTGIAGYVAVNDARGEIVFATRGSSNLRNWLANFNFDLIDAGLVADGEVHAGFNAAWEEMSEGVTGAIASALETDPSYTVVATGHSLGGAVATIGAAALRNAGYAVELYTYGAPRVGNGVLADYISSQSGTTSRITYVDDPVPRVPPIIFGYRHTSPEYWLSEDIHTGDDYPPEEIDVCVGNANIDCNAGTLGFDTSAHSYYFGEISDCTLDSAATASRISAVSDDEMATKYIDWTKQDIEYVKSL